MTMTWLIMRSLLLLAAWQLLFYSSAARASSTEGAEKDALPEIRRELKGCMGSTGSVRCKAKKGTGKSACKGPKGSKSKFKNKPRIRREWRTLNTEKRKKVAE
jgi:hypothetical protein